MKSKITHSCFDFQLNCIARYVVTALKTAKQLATSFVQVLRSTLTAPPISGVDLSAEERFVCSALNMKVIFQTKGWKNQPIARMDFNKFRKSFRNLPLGLEILDWLHEN